MQKVIVEIKQSCQTPEGKDDMKKGLVKKISQCYKVWFMLVNELSSEKEKCI